MCSRELRGERRLVIWVRAALVAAIAVLATGILASSSPALAAPGYLGLTGSDRYETAVQVSQAGFAPGVGAVVLATGENYPDALSAAPLAAAYEGPVLLTPSTSLDERTVTEISRLQPGKIFIVGLEATVVAQVRAAFPDLAATSDGIVALVGVDRYDTARLVAEQAALKLGTVTRVVIAPGDSFADALSAGPLAAAEGWPILLTPAAGPLPEATLQALAALGVRQGLEVGTYAGHAVPGFTLEYIVGVDRYDTSAKIAEYAAAQGLSYSYLAMATGEKFPDGLAAGPYIAKNRGIIVLTQSTGVPAPIFSLLMARADAVENVAFVGLEPATIKMLKMLLETPDWPDGLDFSTVKTGSEGAAVLWLEQKLTDLTYRPGPIDGVFDKRTHQAVIAFQKWEGLARDGVVGAEVWTHLLGASAPTSADDRSGAWIEVDKAKQVLLYVEGGMVTRTLPVSTGSPNVGIVTPSGTFTVYARSPNWDGPRYKPLYLRGILAIHGYPSVPTWPASHGCIRVPLWDMDEFYPLIAVGTKVHVY